MFLSLKSGLKNVTFNCFCLGFIRDRFRDRNRDILWLGTKYKLLNREAGIVIRGPHMRRSVFLYYGDWTQDPEYPRQMFYHWATLPDSRASGPTSREWNFLGWGWGLASIALSSSSSSNAAQGEQVLGVRVKPSIESFECLKSAKQNKSWPQQTRARGDWLLSGYSAVVSVGTSIRAEAAWVSPEQLALEPGLHGTWVQREAHQILGMLSEGPLLKS